MRRHAKLALSVWIAALATIFLFTVLWRVGCFRPHFLWGILTSAAMLIPLVWLAASTTWRFVRGPGRFRAIGWLLIGATPVIWMGAYVAQAIVDVHTEVPRPFNPPLRVAAVWASWIFDIEARWRYPSWTYGRHAVLIDDGRSPHPEKLVADMDRHIEAMADLLGRPVPNREFLWVRGSLFGFNGRAICNWAVCFPENASKPSYVDRHEVAHTLITALAGPDQDPPCLLTEGWAESQSNNRAEQIGNLANARKSGRAYSLQELVEPAHYNLMRPSPCCYWEGGPVVHYLIHRYGPKTFLRLYAGVRRDTFHEDCRAILGDSWEAVEEGFWKWIEAEDKLLARPDPKPRVELAKSVNPADWQTLIEGCRAASKGIEPLPRNVAFVSKSDCVKESPKSASSHDDAELELSAVFEGRQFWIFSNFFPDYNSFPVYNSFPFRHGDSFLMSTPARNADLTRDKSGVIRGEGKDAMPRPSAALVVALRRPTGSASPWLVYGNFQAQETCRIERLVRPAEKTGKWKVWFTKHDAKDAAETRYQMELDPTSRWQVTRLVSEDPGFWRFEATYEYKNLGDAFLQVEWNHHFTGKNFETTRRDWVRAMSDDERRELKKRVEQAADQWKPADPYPWLRRSLLAIVVLCPLGGVVLLGATSPMQAIVRRRSADRLPIARRIADRATSSVVGRTSVRPFEQGGLKSALQRTSPAIPRVRVV